METFDLMELLDATNFGFDVSGTTIYTASDFYTYCRAKWHHMLFDCLTVPYGSNHADAAVITAAKAEFTALYGMWKTTMGANAKRMMDALAQSYDPLENYNRIEEGNETTEHHKGTKTSVGEETISTPGVEVKTTEYTVAFDGSTETETNAATSAPVRGTDKVERDSTKNFTTVSDIDGTTFDNDVHSFTDRVTRGNIGVTTSQQMLEQEIEIRKKNYVADVMDNFILTFCYYAGGHEL